MKARQYKKLCKKSAGLIGFDKCDVEDGIWYVYWHCGGFENEWDSEDAWPWLVARFDGAVNVMIDDNSECGISWKSGSEMEKTTPKNVFAWASTERW